MKGLMLYVIVQIVQSGQLLRSERGEWVRDSHKPAGIPGSRDVGDYYGSQGKCFDWLEQGQHLPWLP